MLSRLAARLSRVRDAGTGRGFGRGFGFLWLSHGVSILGDVLYDVGVMVVVYERTGSALGAVSVMLASKLPLTVLGPIAGAVVDHFPRRRVMITMDLIRAVLVLQLLWLLAAPDAPLWPVYLVVAGLGAAKAFDDPARASSVPSLVPRSELVRANGLLSATLQASYGIGYGVGGVLVLSYGLGPIVVLDAVTFLISAAAIRAMTLPPRAGGTVVQADVAIAGTYAAESMVFEISADGSDDASDVVQGTDHDDASTAEAKPGLRAQVANGFASVREGAVYVKTHPLVRPLIILEVLEFPTPRNLDDGPHAAVHRARSRE